jgi:hypothetical protein
LLADGRHAGNSNPVPRECRGFSISFGGQQR